MNDYNITKLPADTIKQVSAVSLAFIGDAVYDLYIRNRLIAQYPRAKINKLNDMKIKCVNAAAQAQIAHALMPKLQENELMVLKRGRNAKTATMAKNASVTDYKYATGFEALIGYLHLAGQVERLTEILTFSFEWCQKMHFFERQETVDEKRKSHETNL